MRSSQILLLGAIALSAGAEIASAAVLTSSLTDWGNVTIFGPAVTRSGGAKTEIVRQRNEWDRDFDGVFNPLVDGEIVQNVWTEASEVGGAPVFRSYHDLKGSGIPLHNGVGWTGFRTNASFGDTWTITVPGAPIGIDLAPAFAFGVTSRLGNLFPPGSTVALPPNFYPYNPLWGSVPPGVPVIGPLPTAPTVDLFMSIDNYRWYDYKATDGNGAALVPFGGAAFSSGLLKVQNGVPFAIQIDFIAGWQMTHSEIAALIGSAYDRFSTNAVFDASHTAMLSAVTVHDAAGVLQQGWSLTNSQGAPITPIALQVPEPGSILLFTLGGVALSLLSARRGRLANRA